MTPEGDLPPEVLPGGRFEDWRAPRPRYVVADVDGTLLGTAPEASERVVFALRSAQDAGLRVGFATGRMRAAVEPLWLQTRVDGPHVLHNGAMVRAAGETIATWPLERPQAERLLELCRQHDLYAELYVGDGYLVTDDREEAAVHWGMLHQDPSGFTHELDPSATEVVKATVAIFDRTPEPTVSLLRDAGLACGVATSPLAAGVSFINVTHPDADKGVALVRAASHVGVDMTEVVAIGDGHNDLSMLSRAGTAIAMGQAEPAVKELAHLVVPEVDVDGAAHALQLAVDRFEAASTTSRRGAHRTA
ncbi:MAG: Cof-type HAD-IIB family hydrolase [Actinobacteria bacterium]|nr:Cof-type HAD-IIB family hydrolase [Actinomycetota bacterium]